MIVRKPVVSCRTIGERADRAGLWVGIIRVEIKFTHVCTSPSLGTVLIVLSIPPMSQSVLLGQKK